MEEIAYTNELGLIYGGKAKGLFNTMSEMRYLLQSNSMSHTRYLKAPHLMEDHNYSSTGNGPLFIQDLDSYDNDHLTYSVFSREAYNLTNHLMAMMLVQYASDRFWVTGINEFTQCGIDISKALIIRLAVIAPAYKGNGLFSKMLLNLEKYAGSKEYGFAKVNINDMASIKSFFKAGYIIREVCNDLEHFVMFKDFAWSYLLNPFNCNYSEEEEKKSFNQHQAIKRGEYIPPQDFIPSIEDMLETINTTGFLVGRKAYIKSEPVDCRDVHRIKDLVSERIFPLAIHDNVFDCRSIKGLEKEDPKKEDQKDVA